MEDDNKSENLNEAQKPATTPTDNLKLAVNILWASFAISIFNTLSMAKSMYHSSFMVDSGFQRVFIISVIISVSLSLLFNILIIIKVGQARNWARLLLLLYVIAFVPTITAVVLGMSLPGVSLYTPPLRAGTGLGYLLITMAVYLLFTPPTAQKFNGSKNALIGVIIFSIIYMLFNLMSVLHPHHVNLGSANDRFKANFTENILTPQNINNISSQFHKFPVRAEEQAYPA